MIPFGSGRVEPGAWRTFQNLVILQDASSSNDLAREIIELYFTEEQSLPASAIVAVGQSGARGRKGRWVAPPGAGIYLTFIRRSSPGEPISLIPIATARWVRETLAAVSGLEAALKWPNDIYAAGRKLAGILAESRTQGEDTYVAVGIGMNVLGRADALGVPGATTVEEETGRRIDLAPLLQALLDRFDAELLSPGWEREVERWESISVHRPGDRMTVRRDGEELSGEYRGLTREGFLRLGTAAGEEVIAHGELARW